FGKRKVEVSAGFGGAPHLSQRIDGPCECSYFVAARLCIVLDFPKPQKHLVVDLNCSLRIPMPDDAGELSSSIRKRQLHNGIIGILPHEIQGLPVAAFEVFNGFSRATKTDSVVLTKNLALGKYSQPGCWTELSAWRRLGQTDRLTTGCQSCVQVPNAAGRTRGDDLSGAGPPWQIGFLGDRNH